MNPPAQIGHYRIVAKIGEGGMGTVYQATDTVLKRDVAIKVLPAAFANDMDRMARFRREAQVLASLNHPNIAAIYGVEQDAIVMELVDGQDLQGPLPLETALGYARQIADALDAAHEKGIIHRDLKPANIKVRPDGAVKLLDFGLARAAEDTAASASASPTISPTLSLGMTQAGGILGTAAYMSPEQARGKAVDKRADIWAFGAVLYEMLTGTALFVGETVGDTLANVLTREPDLTMVPAQVRPLLARLLARDPKKRLRDIGDAWQLLEPPSGAQAPPAFAGPGRLPWIVAAAFALLTLVLGVRAMRPPVSPALAHRYTLEGLTGFLLSPDGHWVLSKRDVLTVRAHDGVDWRGIPGTEAADLPFWSPDSTTLGFFAGGRLRTVSVRGGDLRNLTAAPAPRGATWKGGVKDGVIVFASDGRLQSFDLTTGQSRTLPIQFPAGSSPRFPTFLPEGDRFFYLANSNESASLYRSSVSASAGLGEKVLETTHKVSFARDPHSGVWHIFFAQGSRLIEGFSLFTAPIDPKTGDLKGTPVKIIAGIATIASTPGLLNFDTGDNGMILWRRTSASLPVWRMHWFDRNGNILSNVGDPGTYTALALSPDETRVAAAQSYPGSEIWMYDLRRGTGARISLEPGYKTNPVWSPDGKSLYYLAVTDEGYSVVRRPADGGGQPEILYSANQTFLTSLADATPDGRYLILREISGQDDGVFRLDVSSLAPRKLELVVAGSPEVPLGRVVRMTPDGRWLLVSAMAGFNNGYVFAYPGTTGKPIQTLTNFLRAPFFSADGRMLYGHTSDARGGLSVAVRPILPAASGNGIRLGEGSLLFSLHPSTQQSANSGAITKDGSRILSIAADDMDELKFQVLTDWTTLLPSGR